MDTSNHIDNPTLHDVLEAINNFATDVAGNFKEVDQKFDKIESKMATGFKDLQDEMASGFDVAKKKLAEIIESLHILEKRTLEDSNAAAKDISDLKRRVSELEKMIKGLQRLQPA